MPPQIYRKNQFNSGVFSPRVWARQDLGKYEGAVETGTNCYSLPHGPLIQRTGSKYIAEVKTSSKEVRLIKFQKEAGDAYVIEMGDQYLRFYKDGARLGAPYELASPFTEAQIWDVSYAQFGDDIWMCHPSHAPRRLHRTSDTSWYFDTYFDLQPTKERGFFGSGTLTPSATTGTGVSFTASAGNIFLTSDIGRQVVYEDSTTGQILGVATITALAAASPDDVLTCDITLDFPDTNPIANGDWRLDLSPLVSVTMVGQYFGEQATVTAVGSADTFRADDVGKFIHVHNGIIEVTSQTATVATGIVRKTLDLVTKTEAWTLEELAWSSSLGFPEAVAVHDQRIYYGRDNTLWGSEIGIFSSFGRGTGDSDAIEVEIPDSGKIKALGSSRDLIVFTTTREHVVRPSSGSTAGTITPSNINQQRRSRNGANVQIPVEVAHEVLFVDAAQMRIFSVVYDLNADGLVSENLLFLADHLPREKQTGIKEMFYADVPDSLLYVILNDGTFLTGNYDRSQQVLSWYGPHNTPGVVESGVSITTGGVDQVWVLVKRYVNGAVKRYVEVFDTYEINDGSDDLDGYFDSFIEDEDPKTIDTLTSANPPVVGITAHGYSNGDRVRILNTKKLDTDTGILVDHDSHDGLYKVANQTANTFELTDVNDNNIDGTSWGTYDTTSKGSSYKKVTTITGLTHLEGKTVGVKTDNAVHPDKTVSSGQITLDFSSARTVVGLKYNMSCKILRPNFSVGTGSMIDQRQRHIRTVLRVYNSSEPLIDGEYVAARSPDMAMDDDVPLFTGELEYQGSDWDNMGQLTITSDPERSGIPVYIQSISSTIEGGVA